MKDPVVSVIIPVFNREKLVVKAIESVIAQTYPDWEILIIDDASTDNTAQVIRDLKNDKISYYKLDKNSGQCVARNYGIKRAKGTYVAFLDSDDIWLPEKLKKQVECFEKGSDKLGCVYGYAYQKDVIKDETTLDKTGYLRGDIYHDFLEGFCPPTPSIFMVKKEALEKVNSFDEKLITFVDLDLWTRVSEFYHFDFIEEPLIIKYEQIGDQYVNNFVKRYNGLKLFIKKWEEKNTRIVGRKGFLELKKGLTYALIIPILDHPPANLRQHIPKLIKLLIDIRCMHTRFYTKSLLILLFGPNIIYSIRNKIN